ncbi:Fibrillin-3 [Chionoecetes opilio]|uniref:Fibrillin-3 n=1 Tax=Chionoecetes opilio TaxID=41210 RepID=A0A8J4XQT8_CHIOP|nr:Fibrillin-3 [Chionoecetes opilio]
MDFTGKQRLDVLMFFSMLLATAAGDLEPTFGQCCAFGANWARESQQCSTFPAIVAAIPPEHQSICITTAAICCLRFFRDEQCQKGKQAAQVGQDCMPSARQGGEYFKDCCQGCKLGLFSGSMGMGCGTRFKFGFPWDYAFLQCCSQAAPGNTSPNLSGNQVKDSENLYPGLEGSTSDIPESENLCAKLPGKLCSDLCVPTPGSYRCMCRPGFTLSIDGKTCVQDTITDRCEVNNPCDHICRDTGVSIVCSCNDGFILKPDQKSCEDINECSSAVHGCVAVEQVCYNLVGSYVCINADGSFSAPGPTPLQDGSPGTLPAGPKAPGFEISNEIAQGRTPFIGGSGTLGVQGFPGTNPEVGLSNQSQAQGRCPPGYSFNLGTQACDDVNECVDGTNNCNRTTHFCVNTQGGYMCEEKSGSAECVAGYKFSIQQQKCIDVDECAEELHGCHPQEESCRNTAGAYECDMACDEGFQFNIGLRTCVDRNECVDAPCEPGWECRNTVGSYSCHELPRAFCPAGYKPSNGTASGCEDVDECVEGLHSCHAVRELCMNEIGKYRCEAILLNEVNAERNQFGRASHVQECPEGFGFDLTTRQCLDIDECNVGLDDCSQGEKCINTLGSYLCQSRVRCSGGFAPDPITQECKDVDECAAGVANCLPGQICYNTEGAFECRVECQDGFRYDPTDAAVCVDINECLLSPCNTGDDCRNTEGSYICITSNSSISTTTTSYPSTIPTTTTSTTTRTPSTCPSGFRRNLSTLQCEDIDECVEEAPCGPEERCVNTQGSYKCRSRRCPPGYQRNIWGQCRDVNECETGEHACKPPQEECVNSVGSYRCKPLPDCPEGFTRHAVTLRCVDVDECVEGTHDCVDGERCFNQYGRYACRGSPNSCYEGFRYNSRDRRCKDIDECVEDSDSCDGEAQTCINSKGSFRCIDKQSTCDFGYRYSEDLQTCIDIDECATDPCQTYEDCENTQGSYQCQCRLGYHRDEPESGCQDMNECQLGLHTCSNFQRCDNTVGSYACIRIAGCGTGYTLNHNTGICDDNDECKLNTHNCDQLGSRYQCLNVRGSFRCRLKTCSPLHILNEEGVCVDRTCDVGYKPGQFNCVDVDECSEGNSCQQNERCINSLGSYRCQPLLVCYAGYEMNEEGTQCVDIDECAKGTHKCEGNQTCSNRQGGYVCHCNEGYRLNTERQCEDINECESYHGRACANNAECENTVGSFLCKCKDGFRQASNGVSCVDMDECEEEPGICQHNCFNVWGSYQCTCRAGHVLGADNRTCTDVDECKSFRGHGYLCIGLCVNVPGSFKCTCPDGYTLAPDGRTCKDVDECEPGNLCRGNGEQCVNTRGGYKCNTITCPDDYVRDSRHKNRCKRLSAYCQTDDDTCRNRPLSYSYNYLPLVSNMTMSSLGQVDLFTMRGPLWRSTTVQFELELEDTQSPNEADRVKKEHFQLRRTAFNQAVISLVKTIIGPQEIQLSLNMKLYQQGRFSGSAVAKLLLYVSEYTF